MTTPSAASAALEARLRDAGFESERAHVAGHDALVARRADFRWRWIATRPHVFVMAIDIPDARVELADDLIDASQQHAIEQKSDCHADCRPARPRHQPDENWARSVGAGPTPPPAR